MQKRCSCYQGISYTEHFYGEYELFENTVHSQMEKRAESVIHARSAEQPLHQLHSGFKADTEAKQRNKKLLAEAL